VIGFIVLAVVIVGLLVCGAIVAGIYNGLVRGRILVREGFSGIDVQLKRRHNLIPNLISTVEGYADFERRVLDDVTRLRTQAIGDESIADKQRDESALSGALRTLFAVAEGYPDLKTSANFLDLQQQLATIEDELQKARRYYNGTVRDFNTRVESFPSNLVAGMFGFQVFEFFELESLADRELPKVKIKYGRQE
jgi:LemA protein